MKNISDTGKNVNAGKSVLKTTEYGKRIERRITCKNIQQSWPIWIIIENIWSTVYHVLTVDYTIEKTSKE